MATVSSSACADDAHAARGVPDDSPESSRLTATPSTIVESGAACPDRLRTRLPSVARARPVPRPAAAMRPALQRRDHRRRTHETAARRLAQRAVETAVSIARKTARSDGSRRSGGIRPVWWRCRGRGSFVRGCRDNADRRAAKGRRAARGFSGPSATAREARRLAAVAPAPDASAPLFVRRAPGNHIAATSHLAMSEPPT